jgi:hypothetical protein
MLRCLSDTTHAAPSAAFNTTVAPRTIAAMLLGTHGYLPQALQERFLPPLLRTRPPTSIQGHFILAAQSLLKVTLLAVGAYGSIANHAMYKAWEVIIRSDTQCAQELCVCA